MLVNSMLCHPAAISRFCKDVGYDRDFTLGIQHWHFTKGNSRPSFMWNFLRKVDFVLPSFYIRELMTREGSRGGHC